MFLLLDENRYTSTKYTHFQLISYFINYEYIILYKKMLLYIQSNIKGNV